MFVELTYQPEGNDEDPNPKVVKHRYEMPEDELEDLIDTLEEYERD